MRPKSLCLLLLLVLASLACASLDLTPDDSGGPPNPPTAVQETPDPDADQDGIVGDDDQCPTEPENVNNIFDTDGCPDVLQDLINLAAQDIDKFWKAEFAEGNLPYTSPETILGYSSSRPIETSCGESIPDNAFYCPVDNSIYYDEGLIQAILRAKKFGDFGTVVVLAHEWGHLAQAELGITHSDFWNIQLELQADCFAGAYGRYLAQGKSDLLRLDEGDLEEGSNILYALGDDQMAWFDPQAHGTRQQRMEAYQTGLDQGTNGCLSQ
jgi:predicted metalloprotease